MPGTCSWECHKCKSVNAPHVDRCACSLAVHPYSPVYPSYPGVQPYPGTVPYLPPVTSPSWPLPGVSTIITYGTCGCVPSVFTGASVSDNVARFTQ